MPCLKFANGGIERNQLGHQLMWAGFDQVIFMDRKSSAWLCGVIELTLGSINHALAVRSSYYMKKSN